MGHQTLEMAHKIDENLKAHILMAKMVRASKTDIFWKGLEEDHNIISGELFYI